MKHVVYHHLQWMRIQKKNALQVILQHTLYSLYCRKYNYNRVSSSHLMMFLSTRLWLHSTRGCTNQVGILLSVTAVKNGYEKLLLRVSSDDNYPDDDNEDDDGDLHAVGVLGGLRCGFRRD